MNENTVTNTIGRIKDYVSKHKIHTKKVDQLFGRYTQTVFGYQSKLSGVPNADNAPLERLECHYHIGDTSEVNGLDNLDQYDRQQVYGDDYEANIVRLQKLYSRGLKYYFIDPSLNQVHPLNQAILKAVLDDFDFNRYFDLELAKV